MVVSVIPPEATAYGKDATGREFMVLPSGTATVNVPAGDPVDGSAGNGAMLSPQANTVSQGYDARADSYDAALTISGDVVVSPRDVIVQIESAPGVSNIKTGVPAKVKPFYVLHTAKYAGGMLPAAVGWAGRDDAPRKFDLDAIMAQHITPNIVDMSAAVGPANDNADLIARLKLGMTLFAQVASHNGERGQNLLPQGLMPGAENYGEEIGIKIMCSVIASIFDSRTSDADRRELVTYFLRLGIDIDDPMKGVGKVLGGNGGIQNGYQGAVLFKRCIYGESLVGFMSEFPGNWAGAFIHTAQTITEGTTPHDLVDSVAYPGQRMPWATIYRTVLSASGSTFTYNPNFPSALPQRLMVTNIMKIRRKSDGAEANVIGASPTNQGSVDRGENPTTITLDAPLSPALAQDDEIVFLPKIAPVVGEADWSVCADDNLLSTGGWSAYRSGDKTAGDGSWQSYRDKQGPWGLQLWVGEKLSGGLPAEFDPVKAYVMLCDAGAYPTCQSGNTEFWNAVKADLT